MDALWFVGAILFGASLGAIIAMSYYGNIISEMTRHSIQQTRKLRELEKKPATMKEIEMFQRGGRFALETMHDFTTQRLAVRLKDLPDMTIYPPEDES